MSKLRFSQYIAEAPIGDYQQFGDWSKAKSFRHKTDRTLVTNPRSIQRLKKKFENTPYNFNLFMVNSTEGRKYTEEGVVTPEFLRKALGDEVADAVANATDADDSINVVFTNNNGSERMPFTAWIIAHRIGHAFARKGGMRDDRNVYMQASNHLIRATSEIMECYGEGNFPKSEREMTPYSGRQTARQHQLTMMHLFQNIATFRSARTGQIRDWFEVLNELIAQYLTTGKIKFNPPPQKFGGKARTYFLKDAENAADMVDMLSRDMEYMIDDIMSSLVGSVLIM